jgi:hypothetical protein
VAASEPETGMKQVDAALKPWRQGDCVLGEQWFVHRFDPQQPLTGEASNAANDGVDLAENKVEGMAVVTQTCDIVRLCSKRPFLEVAALVVVDKTQLSEIQRGRQPQYAFIPGIAEKCLVADLNRVMTVEKAVVAGWHRICGCSTDEQIRDLGRALARKRMRFAFPKDFNELASELQKRLKEKPNKTSDEGEALRAFSEIRVRANPSWNDERKESEKKDSKFKIELTFLFIRNENEPDFKGMRWDQVLQKLLDLIPESGRFKSISGLVTTLEDISAKDYVESDPLDLDHFSIS